MRTIEYGQRSSPAGVKAENHWLTLQQSRREDQGELAAITGQHLDRVYTAALRLTRHHGSAEYIVQETLLKAWRRFQTSPPRMNARRWLFRILVSTYMSTCRRVRLNGIDQKGFDGQYLHDWIWKVRRAPRLGEVSFRRGTRSLVKAPLRP